MKKILIFGLGVSGCGVREFCKQRRIEYSIYDDNPTKCEGDTDDLSVFDLAVISPGIVLSHPFYLALKESGLEVISDIELFKRFAPPSLKIIGITGSNGKSTTASLVYHVLKTVGKNVFLAGNIGQTPLVKECFEAEYCILEVSSFQLESINFMFDAGAVLNISSNHNKEHGGIENYIKAKMRILRGDGFRIAPDGFSVREILPKGYSSVNQKFYINGKLVANLPIFTNLNGEHNLKNIVVALAICIDFVGISFNDAINSILTFKGLPHRIEFVKEVEGVKFVNDSKSTSVDATLSAINTFSGYNIFLIAGGRAKEEGIEAILEKPEFKNIKEVFLIGEASGRFAKSIIEHNKKFANAGVKYAIAGTLERAVMLAFKSAIKVKKGVVLLSPIASSLDQFKNFEERGEWFKKYVNNL